LADLVPGDWFIDPVDSTVLVVGYAVMRVPADRPRVIQAFDLLSVRALLGTIDFPYFDTSTVRFEVDAANLMRVEGHVEPRRTPLAPHLILLTPLRVDGVDGDEAEARSRLEAAAGLLAAFLGRNAVYQLVFENVAQVASGASGQTVSGFSTTIENPLSFPAPSLDDATIDLIKQAGSTLAAADLVRRERYVLALRWFHQALYGGGIDSFLRYWIAIEAVSPMISSDIAPLVRALAHGYGIAVGDVKARYGIDRIYGFRGRILHQGARCVSRTPARSTASTSTRPTTAVPAIGSTTTTTSTTPMRIATASGSPSWNGA
jgi:hypothetical protein